MIIKYHLKRYNLLKTPKWAYTCNVRANVQEDNIFPKGEKYLKKTGGMVFNVCDNTCH